MYISISLSVRLTIYHIPLSLTHFFALASRRAVPSLFPALFPRSLAVLSVPGWNYGFPSCSVSSCRYPMSTLISIPSGSSISLKLKILKKTSFELTLLLQRVNNRMAGLDLAPKVSSPVCWRLERFHYELKSIKLASRNSAADDPIRERSLAENLVDKTRFCRRKHKSHSFIMPFHPPLSEKKQYEWRWGR